MNRQKRKALITGGGIAGPVAALLLQRAGIEAEIYEARDTPEDYASSWLIIASKGRDDTVSVDGSPIPRMILWSGKGKRFGEVRNSARSEEGAPSMDVQRDLLVCHVPANGGIREVAIEPDREQAMATEDASLT